MIETRLSSDIAQRKLIIYAAQFFQSNISINRFINLAVSEAVAPFVELISF